MAGFFKTMKTVFSSDPEEDKPARQLKHPKDLKQGDIIKFRFCKVTELSGKRFQVTEVNTYVFGHDRNPEFTLEGDDGTRLSMTVESDDTDFLSISRPLKRKQVGDLFDLDQFAVIFEEQKDGAVILKRKGVPDGFDGWTDESYVLEVDAQKGAFIKGDHREGFRRSGDGFDYYYLEGEGEEHAVEVEVYDGGETEVSVSLLLPLDHIEEMYPGGG